MSWLSTQEAEEILKKEYVRDNYLAIVDELLPDFEEDRHPVAYNGKLFQCVEKLGKSSICDLSVYEVKLGKGTLNSRVAITQEMFQVITHQTVSNALISFVGDDARNYRVSLLTSQYEKEGENIVKVLSDPRRFSYSLGHGTKTKTAYDFLISKGKVDSLEELRERFSVEVVNKLFYREIAKLFTQLVGGETYDKQKFNKVLKIKGIEDKNKDIEFAVRLIGRIVFCWFLKEKKSSKDVPLIPEEIFTKGYIDSHKYYYHNVLEPLFYEVLNTPVKDRKGWMDYCDVFDTIPYLNGGLFSPHPDDHYVPIVNDADDMNGDVIIPDKWFNDFFDLLNQYNFTVDEDTAYDVELSIDPEMLGRIFENLLAEINPETGKSARNSTGSFYTPRDIVDFMVDTSLSEYLQKTTGIDEKTIDKLISYNRYERLVLSDVEKGKIIDALYDITILDPACGSGAFPIGMLQKIVYILQYVDPDADVWVKKAMPGVPAIIEEEMNRHFAAKDYDYIRKMIIIQRSIFGVDIQPIAVEIARLRCFLSIIIEETVSDEEDNRGIRALPNLEFKFVVANSLSRLADETGTGIQTSIFSNDKLEIELCSIREKYFISSGAEEKEFLKNRFTDIQAEIRAECEKDNSDVVTRAKQIQEWHPFSYESTEWFDQDLMFGVGKGFDIVIGNPPYIALQKIKGRLSEIYRNQNFLSYGGNGDIYCLFIERGIKFLKKEGILTYITSNKWMRSAYGERLRDRVLSQCDPFLLVDFPGQKIFEGATVENNILFLSSGQNKGYIYACNATNEDRGNLIGYVKQNRFKCSYGIRDAWIIENSMERDIKSKIKKYGKPLCDKEWNLNINRGVLTGCNDAFLMRGESRTEIVRVDKKYEKIILPVIRGESVTRYGYVFDDWWIIATFPSKNYDIQDYPEIRDYLLSCREKRLLEQSGLQYEIDGKIVKARKRTNHKWFETQDPIAFWRDFSKPKIIWKRVGSKLRFCYDDKGYIGLDSTCIAVGDHIKYLTAIFNTYIGNYLFKDSPKTGTGDLLISVQAFEPVCVPYPTPELEREITDLFDKICQSDNDVNRKPLEGELESKVSEMYHFDNDELKHIIEVAKKYR